MPQTPALRREQIKLQVALLNPLYHVDGPAAPETKAAAEQAQLFIQKAEDSESRPKTHCFCSPSSSGFWGANFTAFDGDFCRDLATQYLALATKHGGSAALLIGHRMMGVSLMMTGAIVESRAHMIRRCFFMILPSIARWLRDLAKTLGLQYGLIGPSLYGYLAILRLLS